MSKWGVPIVMPLPQSTASGQQSGGKACKRQGSSFAAAQEHLPHSQALLEVLKRALTMFLSRFMRAPKTR